MPSLPSASASPSPSASAALSSQVFQAPALGRRMACWVYEGILLFGVAFIADYLFDALSQSRHALNIRHLRMAFLFIVLGIYFAWFWAKGQTLAMKTWHIRVVDSNGQPITQARALLRYGLSWLWFLPPLAAMAPFALSAAESAVIVLGWVTLWAFSSRFQHQRQFWHDILAGTRLIHAI